MAVLNSALIDSDNSVFSVLGFIRLQLFNGYLWQGSDITEPTAQGAAFYAFENPPADSVASITVVDVTADEYEPSISKITADQVVEIDKQLKEGARSQLEIVNWVSSTLNVSEGVQSLVTLYVVKERERYWQSVALRLEHNERKFVVVGMFDIQKAEPIAGLIFKSVQSISFLVRDAKSRCLSRK